MVQMQYYMIHDLIKCVQTKIFYFKKMVNCYSVCTYADETEVGPWFSDFSRGGRKRLPKFKFSAKFPIGLHVILQIQIKKFENDCYIMWKIILTENPSRFNVEPLLK